MVYPSKTDRAAILAGAVEQIRRQGIRGLSLRSLAASLGLTPNALYRYFVDRAALEEALAGEVSRRLLVAMRCAGRENSPERTIRNIARIYLGFAREEPNLYELLLMPCDAEGASAADHDELWNFVLENVRTITGPQRAFEASIALWAYLHGIAQLEAMKVFGNEKPGQALDFGLDAWLAAAAGAIVLPTGNTDR